MELAKEVIDSLANIQNSNILSEETFLELLDVIISYICKNNSDGKKAARHDYDEESLKIFLHNEHINGPRIEKLCSTYVNNKQDIQTQLELTGDSISHIVDVDWRLHHCVKISTCTTDMPIYNIRVSTRKYNEIKYVTFTCTIQQLQDLVYKLKDAVRHIEKISSI
ncbi:COMM domain-containing protein 3-like isoform X2 [Cataglyphis hispanica]|uniref:COMM domain-containing protein 3-like isoform X2 n=1 Tax=Cataglyphis hispanica TaxID=1086592 RepID=UPI0021802407|nr:COMM domain-containing protein 3-like isoform X2 [Cataglyphis hispanica]